MTISYRARNQKPCKSIQRYVQFHISISLICELLTSQYVYMLNSTVNYSSTGKASVRRAVTVQWKRSHVHIQSTQIKVYNVLL